MSQVIKDILARKYRVILISPESLLSHRIRNDLLANQEFKKLVVSIVIDEAHVISYWGKQFRKKYDSLHVVRDYLPGVPVLAMSATLTPDVRKYIASSLHMKHSSYAFLNEGNERPEITLAVRKCEHPLQSFRDLAFIFKGNPYHPLDIPKTFIYIDNKTEGKQAIKALNLFLLAHLRGLGLIRPYNARHGGKYRCDAMERFRRGDVRVLVCTDAAGMGCDLDDVDIAIQWRVTVLSILLQRWGRIARGRGRVGLAVLLVEPSAIKYNPSEPAAEPSQVQNLSNKKGLKPKKTTKNGLKKGGWTSETPGDAPELRANSPYEGTLVLVQTRGCLRAVLTKAFGNLPVAPVVDCCSSELCAKDRVLKRIEPPKKVQPQKSSAASKIKVPKKGVPHLPTQQELVAWRSRTWLADHPNSKWGASGILNDQMIEDLSCRGPISDYALLEKLLAHQWGFWSDYSQKLFECISQLEVPYTEIPNATRSLKRKAPGVSAHATNSQPIPSPPAPSQSSSQSSKRSRNSPVVPPGAVPWPSTSQRGAMPASARLPVAAPPALRTVPSQPHLRPAQQWQPLVYPRPFIPRVPSAPQLGANSIRANIPYAARSVQGFNAHANPGIFRPSTNVEPARLSLEQGINRPNDPHQARNPRDE